MKNELSIKYQFEQYLKMAGLDKNKMHTIQYIEMRKTFFGAFGQALIVLRDELNDDEDIAIDQLQNMLNQVGDFFLNESQKLN